MNLTETPARKFNYRKWKIPILIASLIIIASLILLLVWVYYIVPSAHGDQFVSVSFEVRYVLPWGNYGGSMEIVYVNGSIMRISHMELTVSVTNSYFVPVEVTYNGFDTVWLIYNQTVGDPADIVTNKELLVWGAFEGWYLPISAVTPYSAVLNNRTNPYLGNLSGYDYYVARKDLSNYTKTIRVGVSRYYMFYEPFMLTWYGQDLYDRPVSPGTYYIYCVAYGKTSKPINLTVTSVLWDQ